MLQLQVRWGVTILLRSLEDFSSPLFLQVALLLLLLHLLQHCGFLLHAAHL